METNAANAAGTRGTQRTTTRFEDWCDLMDVRPETLGAWDCYDATARPASAPDVA